jgi:hypothetical protein
VTGEHARGDSLAAMFVVLPALANPDRVRSAVGYDPVLRCARLAAFG